MWLVAVLAGVLCVIVLLLATPWLDDLMHRRERKRRGGYLK